ncbi:cupin domain-containing protein [Deferrisoma camini]|uniref:cupin domain-containing protein n=1 Tax=Deferrisoma camini TaxID=1035120 RepID=UPI00046CAF62|nr:cupin domain-containing protein [Deferrisoma camini]
MPDTFPRIVTELPQVDLPLEGAAGWLLQGPTRQAVFFRLNPGFEIPEHSHGAQWGIVIQGEIELTIAGEARTYRKGDTYEIGAGVPHSARTRDGALVLDLFEDPARYRPRG